MFRLIPRLATISKLNISCSQSTQTIKKQLSIRPLSTIKSNGSQNDGKSQTLADHGTPTNQPHVSKYFTLEQHINEYEGGNKIHAVFSSESQYKSARETLLAKLQQHNPYGSATYQGNAITLFGRVFPNTSGKGTDHVYVTSSKIEGFGQVERSINGVFPTKQTAEQDLATLYAARKKGGWHVYYFMQKFPLNFLVKDLPHDEYFHPNSYAPDSSANPSASLIKPGR